MFIFQARPDIARAMLDSTEAKLADLERRQVETEDLTELTITRIREGAPASIKFDALPRRVFAGQVVAIKDIGETRQSAITYTAIMKLSGADPRFRCNMTSPLTINTD